MAPLASAPTANADIDDLVEPIVNAISQAANVVTGDSLVASTLAAVDPTGMPASGDLSQAMDGLSTGEYQSLLHGPLQAAADGSAPTTLPEHAVPLEVRGGTDPVIQLSVDGGQPVDAVVDTGSVALAIPWYHLGFESLPWPTTFGVTGYTGGLDYLYATIKVPVDFGDGMVTAPTDVNAVLLVWPQSLANIFNPMYYSLEAFQKQADYAPAIFGMGPNAGEPPGMSPVNTALPGDLAQGALINESGGYLQFGPNPLDPSTSISVDGAPLAPLQVSIDGGPLQQVHSVIDTGGLYGTIPASVVGTGQTAGTLPAGTLISVYTDGAHPTLLYSYTTTETNTLGIDPSADADYNTGNPPFELQPIYVSNDPAGVGQTIFGNPPR